VLVNYIREFQIGRGVPAADSYTFTMYVLAAFLVIGLVCNLAIRPVPDRLFTAPAPAPASPRPVAHGAVATATLVPAGQWTIVGVAWTLAALPLAWGVLKTLTLASQMFR
jgi:hypothetical protein